LGLPYGKYGYLGLLDLPYGKYGYLGLLDLPYGKYGYLGLLDLLNFRLSLKLRPLGRKLSLKIRRVKARGVKPRLLSRG